jgi:hypothetical protein
MNTKHQSKRPGLLGLTGYTPEQAADLVSFYLPENPTHGQESLTADVVALDHRSLRRLGAKSPERHEIKRLLCNAVIAAFSDGETNVGRLLYQKAEQTYYDHIQTHNRLRFLLGMVIGTTCASALGSVSSPLASFLRPYVPAKLLGLFLVFSGLGIITSVPGRLSSLELRQESNDLMLLISVATKPLVAIVLAVVVFLALELKIVEIHVGDLEGDKANGLYLISAFLCGFSERFASDIIARVSFSGPDAIVAE